MTVPQALSKAARKFGDRPALIGPGVALSHAQLDACVARAAAALEKQGVNPGDVVGVSMETSPLHLVTLLALGRAGACSVHVRPEHPQPVKEAFAAQFGYSMVVGEPGGRCAISADPSWLEPGKVPAQKLPVDPGLPWRISLSSGTTGLQKAVLVSHAQTLAYLSMQSRWIPVSGKDRFLCHRGLDSNLVFNTVLCHLLAGGVVAFPASRSLEHLFEAVDRHEITQLVISPAYLRDIVERLPAGAPRFPTLRKLRVGGSSLPPQVAEAGLARVSPNLFASYGSSEFGLHALADRDVWRRAPSSAGRIVPGVQAEVVGEGDTPLPPGASGALRFRREGMPHEYIRNPEASANAFRGGWFYPGDAGRIDAEGLVYVEGRADDKLNLDGVKIEPAPIERALQEHPAVVEAAVFAAAPDGGPPTLFAAAVLRAPVAEKALVAHCRSRVGPMFTPMRIFFVKELPRNEAGKILRTELSRRVARPKS